MSQLPTIMPDWTIVASWAGGIASVLAAMFVAAWQAFSKARQIAETAPAPVHKTDIYTTDTLAMDRLAGTIEASNVVNTETNVLRREELADRKLLREALEANTNMNEKLMVNITEARTDIRELGREISHLVGAGRRP